jgi:hypothetical protein
MSGSFSTEAKVTGGATENNKYLFSSSNFV